MDKKKYITFFHLLLEIDWIKTLRFNVHYFKLRDSLKMPVWIFRRTTFNKLEGSVQLMSHLHPGMVRIGVHNVGSKDGNSSRTVWHIAGHVLFGDHVSIGRGTGISVSATGELRFGNGFVQNGASEFICHNNITFGDNCLVSWDVLMMDTDLHYVLDSDNRQVNTPKPIHIGSHVWIGCRSTILKGVSIAEDTIIASGSTISKSCERKNIVLLGSPDGNRILKENVFWSNQGVFS